MADEEIKDEQALGRSLIVIVKGALKHPAFIIALGTGAVWGWARPTQDQPKDVYWDKEEIREIMREELARGIAPLESGFRALVKRQPKDTQIAVFESMEAARRRRGDN